MNYADGSAGGGGVYAGTPTDLLRYEMLQKAAETEPHDDDEKKSKKTLASEKSKKGKQLINLDRRNFLLHFYYVRKDFAACRALSEEMVTEFKQMCEYPVYIRGNIALTEGDLRDALNWYGRALALNGSCGRYVSQLGHVHFLLGNHEKAADILLEAIKRDPNCSKTYYWRSMALYHIGQNAEAVAKAQECLVSAPNAAKSLYILIFLAKLCAQKNEIVPAIEAYKKALELDPENLDVMTNAGLLFMRTKSEEQAFAMFGKALSYNPSHAASILGAGSIIQTSGDYDVALTKYRVAADKCDYNGPLWNNIGMCFFGKSKYVAAISCLKKANYLCPLDWKIAFNLGLVHNAMQQYASAYHFLASAANLSPRSPIIYMALGVVLANLDDAANARKAYERAVRLEKGDNPQVWLNFGIFEAKQKDFDKAREYLNKFEELLSKTSAMSQETRTAAENLRRALAQYKERHATSTPSEEPTQQQVKAEE